LALHYFNRFFEPLHLLLDGNIVVYKTGKLLKRKKSQRALL
jgi:hypothetical protein